MKSVLLLAPLSSVHERFNTANILALKELGCEIHLAANFSVDDHAKAYRERMQQQGFITNHIPFVRSSLFGNLLCIPQLRRLLREGQYDIAHCHTETGGLLTRLCMPSHSKTKYVYTPHGLSFYKGSSLKSQCLYRPLERWICSKMSAVLAMNQEEWEVLRGWNANTARFIHGVGVSLGDIQNVQIDKEKKRKELGVPPHDWLILSAGELNANKNHKVVLQALSRIPDPKPYYLICGEGDQREALTVQIQTLGLADHVLLLGYRYDLPELLAIADVFVFPSYHEGLSVALMQAMAAGLPVVCSPIRGNVDLIVQEQGGDLQSPDDADALCASIATLLRDAPLRKAMGAFNQQKIKAYSIEHVQREIKSIYQELLQ